MSAVNVLSVSVLDNPTGFRNPLQFEIQYECTQPIRDGESAPGMSHRARICVTAVPWALLCPFDLLPRTQG